MYAGSVFEKLPAADPAMVDRVKDELATELRRVSAEAKERDEAAASLNREKVQLERALAALKSV